MSNAGNVGDVSDVFNALGIASILFYFLIPTFVILLVIYCIRRLIRYRKYRPGKNEKNTQVNGAQSSNIVNINKEATNVHIKYKEMQKKNKQTNNNKIYNNFMNEDINFRNNDYEGKLELSFNKNGKISTRR